MPTEYIVIMAIRLIEMDASDRSASFQSTKRTLPHKPQGIIRGVCNSLRHGVSQQNFQTVYIIHEQLFDCAGAFILNDTKGSFSNRFEVAVRRRSSVS